MNTTGTVDAQLKYIITKIDIEYYTVIKDLNYRIAAALAAAGDVPGEYYELCRELSEVVKTLVAMRQSSLLPYLDELQRKKADGHNCIACSGGCKVQHNMYLVDIAGSHTQLKQMIGHIDRARILADPYEAQGMVHLYETALVNTLLDLFEVEAKQLVPQIVQTQKAINAH